MLGHFSRRSIPERKSMNVPAELRSLGPVAPIQRFCPNCGHEVGRRLPATCSECRFQMWNNPIPSAGALVTYNSQLLLVRRAQPPWSMHWDLPGGFCEPGEHPRDTAIREVFEETGLTIEVMGYFGIWMDEYEGRDTLNILFDATWSDPDQRPALAQEIEALRWFSYGSLPGKIAFPRSTGAALMSWHSIRINPHPDPRPTS